MTCVFSYNDRIYDSVYTRNNTGQRKHVFSHILAVFGLNSNLCNKLMVSEIYCSCSYVSWIVFFLKNSFFLKKSFFSKINLVWYDETLFWENVFFLSGFLSQILAIHRKAWEGRGTFFISLCLPHAHEHSDIYLQLCIRGDYHVFLIASFVTTRLLLDEIYRLPFDWLMIEC